MRSGGHHTRTSMGLRWVAAVRLALGLVAAGCAPIDHTPLIAPAKADVCNCLHVDCETLDTVPIRFVDASRVWCGEWWAAACYHSKHGIVVATINPGVDEYGIFAAPFSRLSDYQLSIQLRHEMVHAFGIAHGNPLMSCQWEPR